MTAARDIHAEGEHRLSQAAQLRRLFESFPGQWFSNVDLQRLMGGQRYGARILELRRGADGFVPLDIRKERMNGKGSAWRYRCFGVLPAPEPKPGLREEVAQLRAELQALRAELQQLAALKGGGQ